MEDQVLVTSPHHQIAQLVRDIGKELKLNVVIVDSEFEDTVGKVKGILADDPSGISVIVSRGATLKLLRESVPSIPCVSIDSAEYDIILALDKASRLGERISVFAPPEKIHAVETAARLLKLAISIHPYSKWGSFYEQVRRVREDGTQVLVGGGDKAASEVAKWGIKYVPLLASEITIRAALERAKDIIETSRREREQAERLRAVVEHSHEGVILLDEEKRFVVFNPVALKAFALNSHDVLGRPLDHLSFKRSLVELFAEGGEKLGYLHKTKDAILLVNKVPLYCKGRFKGVLVTFQNTAIIQEEERTIRKEIYTKGFVAKFHFDDIVHASGKMAAALAKAKKFADNDCTVLIYGESGTGKELIAQSMHNAHRRRRNGPFVAVNCASLEDSLLRSELFGYVEGAFTGASKGGRAGLFELAHGGTIYLDEISKIRLDVQAHLLRVIQEKEVRRIGSDRVIPVDVRIVASTNDNLEELIAKGSFLKDLFFRLNLLGLHLAPLRERKEDIPGLVATLVHKLGQKYDKEIAFPPEIVRALTQLDWPGNVRQLEYLIERCIVLADDEPDAVRIMQESVEEELGKQLQGAISPENSEDASPHVTVTVGTLKEMENEIVRKLSTANRLTKSELAYRLNISRPTLWKMLNGGKRSRLN
jgi:transcriptional regulator with PAS, ATPase and Fis domain